MKANLFILNLAIFGSICGASLELSPNFDKPNRSGYTRLHLAAMKENKPEIKLLLERGADVTKVIDGRNVCLMAKNPFEILDIIDLIIKEQALIKSTKSEIEDYLPRDIANIALDYNLISSPIIRKLSSDKENLKLGLADDFAL